MKTLIVREQLEFLKKAQSTSIRNTLRKKIKKIIVLILGCTKGFLGFEQNN